MHHTYLTMNDAGTRSLAFRRMQKLDIRRMRKDLVEAQKTGDLDTELILCRNLAMQNQEINHLEEALKFYLSVYQIAKTIKNESEIFDARSMIVRFLSEMTEMSGVFTKRFALIRSNLAEMRSFANRKKVLFIISSAKWTYLMILMIGFGANLST